MEVKLGLGAGHVNCGIVGILERCEYTTLGNAVNFSARLMMKADFGEVLVAESLANHAKFTFEHKGDFAYKGFKKTVHTYQLMTKKSVYERFHMDIMIGRQSELKQLQAWVQPIYHGTFAGIAYVYDEAGMGKSRLIFEFYQSLGRGVRPHTPTWFSCQCDSILKQSFNPFVYAMRRYFNQDNSESLAERKAKFEAKHAVLV